MVHQTRYGTVVTSSPQNVQMELVNLASEIIDALDQNSPMDVLVRSFNIKLDMLAGKTFPLSSSEKRLLDDSISAMRGTVEGLLGLDKQRNTTEAKYLALLTLLVENLLGGKTMVQQQDIQNTVNGLVAAHKAFTSYNVTKELRAAGQQVSHREVRNSVHGMFRQQQMAGYQQTQVQPNGFPSPAILYYPPEIDPNDFTGEIITAKVQPTPPAPTTTDDDDEDDDDDSDSKVVIRSLTADGVLYVPRWMGREMNAQPGKVYVTMANGDLEVRVGYGGSDGHVHVDPRKNMRIGKKTLITLGANWVSYEIAKEGDHVVIRQSN